MRTHFTGRIVYHSLTHTPCPYVCQAKTLLTDTPTPYHTVSGRDLESVNGGELTLIGPPES
jgi:hypothetical protein